MLKEGPWNFDNKLIFMHPWARESPNPPEIFDRTYIWLWVQDLPAWCYTPKIELRLTSILEDSQKFEICNSADGMGNFSVSGYASYL